VYEPGRKDDGIALLHVGGLDKPVGATLQLRASLNGKYSASATVFRKKSDCKFTAIVRKDQTGKIFSATISKE